MKHPGIEAIKKELYSKEKLHLKAEFRCISDNIATFRIMDVIGTGFHSLDIISKSAEFFKSQPIANLFSQKDIVFAELSYWNRVLGGESDRIGELLTYVKEDKK